MVPSVKGSAFQSVLDDVKRLISEGAIEPEDLGEKNRGLLDETVTAVSWIPIDVYAELLDLLARVEGGADPRRYLRNRGREAAERLLGGTYKVYAAQPGAWGRRAGEAMLGISRMLYNFMSWSFRELPDDVCELRVDDAADFPGSARETALGFITEYASRAAGRKALVEVDGGGADQIVYRMRLA